MLNPITFISRVTSYILSFSFLTLIAVTSILVPARDADAQTSAFQCNSCSSSQISTVAQQNCGPAGNAAPDVYVYDLVEQKLYNVGITWLHERGPCAAGAITDVTNNGSKISTSFNLLSGAAGENGGSLSFSGNTSSSSAGFPSADKNSTIYDIVMTSAIQNDISEWLLNNQSLYPNGTNATYNIDTLVQAALSIVLKGNPIVISIAVTTSDGGKATFQYTPGAGNEYVLTKAVDQSNNTVPLNRSQIGARYRFGSGGAEGMHQVLSSYGANLAPGNYYCSGAVIACTSSPTDITCTINCP